MKTLIILGHPRLEISKFNKKIKEELEQLDNVTYHHIDKIKKLDIKKEQEMIEEYDRVILQFPIYWGSMPGKMKEYFDEVFNNQWAYGAKFQLKDKPLMVIMTFGNEVKVLDKLGIGVIYTLGISGIPKLLKSKPKNMYRYYSNKDINKFIKKLKKKI